LYIARNVLIHYFHVWSSVYYTIVSVASAVLCMHEYVCRVPANELDNCSIHSTPANRSDLYYFARNPDAGYCAVVIAPKIRKLEHKLEAEKK